MMSAYARPYTLWGGGGGGGRVRYEGVGRGGGGGGKRSESGVSPSGGSSVIFSWREIAQEIAWPLSSLSNTCFLVFLSIRIL